jgi:hypothetical protein
MSSIKPRRRPAQNQVEDNWFLAWLIFTMKWRRHMEGGFTLNGLDAVISQNIKLHSIQDNSLGTGLELLIIIDENN